MNRRPLAPFWLATPSRFAAVSPRVARVVLALLALLLLATLLACVTPPPRAETAAQPDGQTDTMLYQGIVEGIRHGGHYYQVAAEAQRAGNYPLKPFITFRLPTLAMVQATLPHWLVTMLLYALVLAVFVAWYRRLSTAFARRLPIIVAMTLLAGGLLVFLQADLSPFHEIWAGLLIALSLGVRRPEAWLPSVALGLAAVLIRETAGLYLLLMAALALAEGRRREAAAWVAAMGIVGVVLALHAHAVAQVVRPLDLTSPGWADHLGFGFFVRTMALSTVLALAPLWLAAPLVGLALFGWASWPSPLALRELAVLCSYAAVLAIFGRSDTFYWGLLVAPPLLVGLAFVPDGLRDLVAAARDTRRITVTRVTR